MYYGMKIQWVDQIDERCIREMVLCDSTPSRSMLSTKQEDRSFLGETSMLISTLKR